MGGQIRASRLTYTNVTKLSFANSVYDTMAPCLQSSNPCAVFTTVQHGYFHSYKVTIDVAFSLRPPTHPSVWVPGESAVPAGKLLPAMPPT